MSKTVSTLIVRCVAVEKLDAVIDACRAAWPLDQIAVLTDGRCHAEIAEDLRIDEAIHATELDDYGFQKIWSTSRRFQRVIIPMGNASGVGYANVFRYLSWVRSKEWLLAPRCTELKPIQRKFLTGIIRRERGVQTIATPLASCMSRLLFSKTPDASFRL
ncbi:MAG: hypothetical protein MK080_01095 [Opitutales bacterium]|nr:hypothetical protein [Opitutales bacterium]